MKRQPEFNWYEEEGMATCVLTDKHGREFVGTAICHEADREYMSQKVGGFIAEARAIIAYYKYLRDKTAAELQALKHFHSVISQSKRYECFFMVYFT